MTIKEFMKIGENLTRKENWTDELRYVHITRLIVGFILGIIVAVWSILFL